MRLFAIYPEVLADRKTAEVMAHAMIWTEDADVAGQDEAWEALDALTRLRELMTELVRKRYD